MSGIFETLTIFVSFSLAWDPVGVKFSKRYPSNKSSPNVFKHVLNFPPGGLHKTAIAIFENLGTEFLTVFFSLAWDSAGVKLSK